MNECCALSKRWTVYCKRIGNSYWNYSTLKCNVYRPEAAYIDVRTSEQKIPPTPPQALLAYLVNFALKKLRLIVEFRDTLSNTGIARDAVFITLIYAYGIVSIASRGRYLPILCTYFDGRDVSSQHGKPGVELKHHLRLMYKKNTNINATRPKMAPRIVVLSILTAGKDEKRKKSSLLNWNGRN